MPQVKKELKEFLKFEKKKLILPVLFVSLFAISVLSTITAFQTLYGYACDGEEMKNYIDEKYGNDTINRNISDEDWKKIMSFSEEMAEKTYAYMGAPMASVFVSRIYPLFPTECALSDQPLCYMTWCFVTEDDCNLDSFNLGTFAEQCDDFPVLYYPVRGVLLFVEGYLISSVIIFACSKIWHRKGKAALTEVK
jgi:hypothetical protein